ncbi:MAG: O-antigen ligase family protein [Zoogloeaceae bacterium]|nr:O-antigen ligase family protein [Zoogloeaceae bacterium]
MRAAMKGGRAPDCLAFALLCLMILFVVSPRLRWVANFYYVFVALPGLCLLLGRRFRIRPCSAELILWIVFLFWVAAQGAFLSAHPGGWRYVKYVFHVVLFLVVAGRLAAPRIFRTESFARLAFWTLAGYIIMSWLAQWGNGSYIPGQPMRDLLLHVATTTYFPGYLLVGLFALLLPRLLRADRWVELPCALGVTLFIQAYLIQTRAGLASLVAVLLVATVISLRVSRRAGLYFLGVLLVLAGVALLAWWNIPELHSLTQRGSSGRGEIWSKYLAEWSRCGVWLGCGPKFQSRLTLDFAGGIPLLKPHNLFLSLAVYNGLCALLSFCTLCVLALSRAWRNRDPWGGFLLAGLVVLTFSGGELFMQPNMSWVLCLFPIALISNAWERRRQASPGAESATGLPACR